MEIKHYRFADGSNSTLGIFQVDNKFQCFTCEDEGRNAKVAGETRIPSGRYQIKLRTAGKLNEKYRARFPKSHKGMLWLQNVKDFEYIYIHIGNDEAQTDGCILVANAATKGKDGGGTVSMSEPAYLDLYAKIIQAMDLSEEVFITISDRLGESK